jgi:ribose 5-phosphate isomerase A
MSIEREKELAAQAAADLVEHRMTVGPGTGSTVAYLLQALVAGTIRCGEAVDPTAARCQEMVSGFAG